ncbi:hypothetical protein [Streptomyces sp. BH104]|uniref:hypothetical protein n=1 Tax=Streptomyces sp. BH104 TaxID=3410407 RepID=UPI003BB55382
MSEFSVAIVSASGAVLGAVGGGLVTGIITLRNSRIQARAQRETDDVARREERFNRHSEIRRTVYAEFMDAITDLYEACRAMHSAPLADAERFEETVRAPSEAVYRANRRLTVVTLEGPPDVAKKAGTCASTAINYYQALLAIAASVDHTTQNTGTLGRVIGNRCDRESRVAHEAEIAFVFAARKTLGGHT